MIIGCNKIISMSITLQVIFQLRDVSEMSTAILDQIVKSFWSKRSSNEKEKLVAKASHLTTGI